jgi:hypothetical protein
VHALQYNGGRDANNFVKFLNEKCGTSRLLGGKLSEEVSRLEGGKRHGKRVVDEGRVGDGMWG